MRTIYIPGGSSSVLPVKSGGTGAPDRDGASINLGFIKRELINVPNGIAGLDTTGHINAPIDYNEIDGVPSNLNIQIGGNGGLVIYNNKSKLNASDFPTGPGGVVIIGGDNLISNEYIDGEKISILFPTITGPTTLASTSVGTYTITNFDQFATYTLSAISGTVSRSGATITYTAPATEGTGGFIINNRTINVAITGSGLNTPSITAPANNAVGVSQLPTLTATAFGYFGTAQTHSESRWEISTNNAFSAIVAQYEGSANKTSWTVSTSLAGNVQHYARVRYKGSSGQWSNWSPTITFKIAEVINFISVVGGVTNDMFADIARDSEGNIYAVGYETSTSSNSPRPYIAKFNTSGALVWQRKLNYVASFHSIDIDSSNNIYLTMSSTVSWTSTGWPRDGSDAVVVIAKFTSSGTLSASKLLLIKLTTNMNTYDSYNIYSNTASKISCIKVHPNGSIYVAACGFLTKLTSALAYVSSFQGYYISVWHGGTGDHERITTTTHYIYSTKLVFDTLGNIITSGFGGAFESTTYVSGYYPNAGGGGYGLFAFAKFDINDNLVWARWDGNSRFRFASSLAINNNNEIFICGNCKPTTDSVLITTGVNSKMYVLKASSAGNLVWMKAFSNFSDASTKLPLAPQICYLNNALNSICFHNGFIYVVGSYTSGNTEAFIAKINESTGVVVWQYKLTGAAYDMFTSVKIYNETTLMISGLVENVSTATSGFDGMIMLFPMSGAITEGSFATLTELSLTSTFFTFDNFVYGFSNFTGYKSDENINYSRTPTVTLAIDSVTFGLKKSNY